MRNSSIVVVVLALGSCGDDSTAADVGDSTGTGTSAGTASSSIEGSGTTTVDSTSSTSLPTTTADTSTAEVTTSAESSSTGDPVDPFGPAIEVPLDLDFEPLALALADIDGDGALDALITGTADGTVVGATLLGDGAGGFAAAIDAEIIACSAFPIVGAIDDDAQADLFFGTCAGDPRFFLGNPDGTFTATQVLEPWAFAPIRSSRFVDHDGDGADDLVLLTVAGRGAAQLHLALGQGAGNWPVTTTDIVGQPSFDPDGLAIAQIDGDGRGDVVIVDVGQSVTYMLAQSPQGHADPVLVALEIAPSSVATLDLETDGLDELIVASRSEGALQLVRNADGVLEADAPIVLGGVAPLEVAVGRFDGDAEIDLAVLDGGSPSVVALQGDGAGGFVPIASRELPALAVRLIAGDLDGDGRTDLVAATFASGSITILLAQ